MRTLLAGELTQAQSYASDYYIRLEVQNGSGTWIDVGAALGRKWIVNASWGETVDVKVAQYTFTLWQEMGGNSLSPLMATSVLNRDDFGAYAPLLNVGRPVRAFVATMPHLVALDPAKYREFVTGRIDNVRQVDSLEGVGPITIICSDLGGWLMDMQIETSGIQYGTTPVGTPLETVLQNVLTANIPAGEPAVTLLKQSTSNFAVTDWQQDDTKVLDALSTLVLDSTGEDLRYRYDASHASRLTWFNPDRTRVTVDATFAPGYTLRSLDLALANIRNAGEMPYQGGGVARAISPASILNYRRRFFRLPASPMITTLVDAQKVIDAVVNDLSAPPGEAAAEIPFFWPVQLYDRYTFQANGRQYDTDQTFAVMGYQHTIENSRGSTTLTLTARIVGAFSEWLQRLGRAAASEPGELRDVTWTETGDEELIRFTAGAAVTEVWAGYALVPAPVQATDFDLKVAPFVVPLAAGATTFVVPRPPDGKVTLVLLSPRRSDLSAGRVRRLTITATPQPATYDNDDTEIGTLGTQWVELSERGIKHVRFEVQTQDGDKNFSPWRAPTRIAGAASTVKGGVLDPLAMEQDITLDAKGRLTYVSVRHLGENGIWYYLQPFPFDPDSEPTLVSIDVAGSVIKVLADSDTASIGVYSTALSYGLEFDGQYGSFDIAGPGNAPSHTNTPLPFGGFTDTFKVRAYKLPLVAMDDTRFGVPCPFPNDERLQTVTTPAGAPAGPAATVAELTVLAPSTGSDVCTIKLRASSAPGGWTAHVFVSDPSTAPAVDETGALTPALTTPPIVLTSYAWSASEVAVFGGIGARLRTLTFRAELWDGSSNVMHTKTVNVSYYTSDSFY